MYQKTYSLDINETKKPRNDVYTATNPFTGKGIQKWNSKVGQQYFTAIPILLPNQLKLLLFKKLFGISFGHRQALVEEIIYLFEELICFFRSGPILGTA